MCFINILSKHFITIDVSAMGRELLRQVTVVFLMRGMMMVDLNQVGTTVFARETL